MLDFKIDKTKCIQCGLCAADCPVRIIEMKEVPTIAEEKEANCLQCQHCLAVCPTGALSILGKDPGQSVSTKAEIPTTETMVNLVKTRRSIRKFKPENVEKALLDQLLEATGYAPTAKNDNAVLQTIIDDREVLASFRVKFYDAIKQAGEIGALTGKYEFLNGIQKVWETKGIDILFRDAPHLLITSAPETGASPVHDSLIAMSYFELLANSAGVGTLWNGFINWVLNDIAPELATLLGIPSNHKIGFVIVFGKPAVRYARAVQSDGAHINRITQSTLN